jgi:pimeloyl-ACP methyl ester carboxylesterase
MDDLINALDFDEVDLIGSRVGSSTGVELAIRHPQRVRRVVMISAPLFTDAERAELRARFAPVTLGRDDPQFVDAWTRYVADAWAQNVKQAMPGWTLDHLAEQFPDVLRRPDISWWGHNAKFDYPLAARLPEVRQPMLVLNPGDDLHEQTSRAGALLVKGRVHELPGWGLGFLDVRADQTARIVRDFLNAGQAG